ncbi:MAG: flavodoxin domain-containing protein [Thaumarchaeota archaeon]|nr:flavodoxin domain-containing protein [Nitrososphaerota archaeon]
MDGNPAQKSAVVVYDSRFGNTKRIAEALELGLRESEARTDCQDAKDVLVEHLKKYDLICVGAPTEKFSASDSMKEFLGKLKGVDLSGKTAFVFDTKVSPGIFGSAAKYIEKELKNLGIHVLSPRESATVSTTREGGAISGATLKEGEEKKFEEIGKELGKSMVASVGSGIPA